MHEDLAAAKAIFEKARQSASIRTDWAAAQARFYVFFCLATQTLLPLDQSGVMKMCEDISSRTMKYAHRRTLAVLLMELQHPTWTATTILRPVSERPPVVEDELFDQFSDAGSYIDDLLRLIHQQANR